MTIERGYTLLEMMIVIALVSVVFTQISFSPLLTQQQNNNLTSAQQRLDTWLQRIQHLAAYEPAALRISSGTNRLEVERYKYGQWNTTGQIFYLPGHTCLAGNTEGAVPHQAVQDYYSPEFDFTLMYCTGRKSS
ncbi:pilus assembly FimT family protein [Serratia quinivorans]|uniref:pilus assembly FimT family protein n=1 Tax=Serratia quinivorans TaxID=137545 RepID=UPI0021BAFF83|nr:prepilin-type N-terminal cleavage/methylation domain-containing protein [Serratia quinivorans]